MTHRFLETLLIINLAVLDWWLDLMILETLLSLNDSLTEKMEKDTKRQNHRPQKLNKGKQNIHIFLPCGISKTFP